MKILRLLHRWTGAALCLFIAMIALTGAAATLHPEYLKAVVPRAGERPPALETLGPALIVFEHAEPGVLQSVKASPYGLGTHRVYLTGGRTAWIDADGRVVARSGPGERHLDDLIVSLHHTFLAGDKGEKAAGLIGLGGLLLALSGVVLFIPASRAFSFALWPKSLQRRDFLAAHRNLAIILAFFAAVQFATGAMMIYDKPLSRVLGVEVKTPKVSAERPPPPEADWPKIFRAAHQRIPDGRVRQVFLPRDPGDAYRISFQRSGDINPEGSTVVFTDGWGEVLAVKDGRSAPLGGKLMNSLLGLHQGAWGGAITRWLNLAVGLGLGFIALFGLGAFLRSFSRRRGAE